MQALVIDKLQEDTKINNKEKGKESLTRALLYIRTDTNQEMSCSRTLKRVIPFYFIVGVFTMLR